VGDTTWIQVGRGKQQSWHDLGLSHATWRGIPVRADLACEVLRRCFVSRVLNQSYGRLTGVRLTAVGIASESTGWTNGVYLRRRRISLNIVHGALPGDGPGDGEPTSWYGCFPFLMSRRRTPSGADQAGWCWFMTRTGPGGLRGGPQRLYPRAHPGTAMLRAGMHAVISARGRQGWWVKEG